MRNGFERRRDDFPALSSGKLGVYLDSAASSQTPIQVLEAMDRYYTEYRANVHRGMYKVSEKATETYEEARRKVADFINAAPEEIVFTRGTTESLNLLAYAIAPTLSPGDEVVTTLMDHHADFVPWQQMCKRYGLTFKWIPIKDDYTLDMEAARRLIGPKTKVVAVTHASNVLGTINPVKKIGALARERGAYFIVDAAQSAPHFKLDVRDIDCDFLAFSGHKMLGPTGIGVLYGKRARLEALQPFLFGGDMILDVDFNDSVWNEVPYKFEAGTPNIAGAIGLGAAVDYLSSIGMDEVAWHERTLTDYAFDKLTDIEGLKIIGPGPDDNRLGVVSFVVDGIHPHDLVTILDREGVSVRGGHHCAMPLLKTLGLTGTVRASFYIYNLREGIDALAAAVLKAKEIFAPKK